MATVSRLAPDIRRTVSVAAVRVAVRPVPRPALPRREIDGARTGRATPRRRLETAHAPCRPHVQIDVSPARQVESVRVIRGAPLVPLRPPLTLGLGPLGVLQIPTDGLSLVASETRA